jgi:tRNA(Ile)-lysidine synthase
MTQSVDQAMRAFAPALPLAVAFSGGADSTALLVACVERWPEQVMAVHVNHGLQTGAGAFERQCQAVCRQLQVPLVVQRVDARHLAGQSPEDAARRARYKAFSVIASVQHAQAAIQSIAIAQHADDQIETLLLALSRGAGLAGLSAMPTRWQRDGLDFHRPLLAVSGLDIRRWLEQRQFTFIEDPTNLNQRFTRNRIRALVVPALREAFPQFLDTFARSASHAAQAQALLEEVAAQDFLQGYLDVDRSFAIAPLQALSQFRQANVIRHWLNTAFQVVPSAAQLNELLDQISACTTRGHAIHIKVGPGFLRRRGAALHWYNP